MFDIARRFSDWGQEIVFYTRKTRITVQDFPPPEFSEEDLAKPFNNCEFFVLETDSRKLEKIFSAIAEKREVGQYLWIGPANAPWITRIVLACPAGIMIDYQSDRRNIIQEFQEYKPFKKLLEKFSTPFITIIRFNVEGVGEFRGMIGAIYKVVLNAGARNLSCHQVGEILYLIVGTSEKAMVGKAA